MPDFSRVLEVFQGFNFKKDRRANVGVLTALTIGQQKFAPDFKTVPDPLAPTKNLEGVVAVLSSISWKTGTTDTIYISGQISVPNRQKLAEMLLGSWDNLEVVFKYAIYEYDPVAKKYFRSSYVDKELKGLVEKNGSELTISVGDEPSTEVESPQNHPFQIGIKPQNLEQEVNLAVGVEMVQVKKWGISAAA